MKLIKWLLWMAWPIGLSTFILFTDSDTIWMRLIVTLIVVWLTWIIGLFAGKDL